MSDLISMSAIAKGRDLHEVAQFLLRKGFSGTEIAIGPRPVDDPMAAVNVMKAYGIELRAHHSVPLGKNRILRPDSFETAKDLAVVLYYMGIKHYSMHPPMLTDLSSFKDLLSWFLKMHEIFARRGVSFAIETMYPAGTLAATRQLYNAAQTFNFLESIWNDLPDQRVLVVDLAHIFIGRSNGYWNDDDVEMLFHKADQITEVHYSANDGVRDLHRQITGSDERIRDWLANVRFNHAELVFVSEARR